MRKKKSKCECLYETLHTHLFLFSPHISAFLSLPILQPLLPIERNGPGLEYKVSYRRQDVEDDAWKEEVVERHSFVVKNTPTFVPYEIKIDLSAVNHENSGNNAPIAF